MDWDQADCKMAKILGRKNKRELEKSRQKLLITKGYGL
jgi:hypothetical protein